MAQVSLQGPPDDFEGPNTRPEASERGWSWKKALDTVNTMFGEVYANLSTLNGQTLDTRVSGIEARFPSGIELINGAGVPANTVQASLATNLTGTNNDLDYTAVPFGAAGNAITIAYVDPGANNAALSVTVLGNAITFHLATGVAGAITTIASDIKTALLASVPASALVTAADHSGNDATGVVIALTATHLAGGIDGAGQGAAGKGSLYSDTTNGNLYINSGSANALVWKLVTRAA